MKDCPALLEDSLRHVVEGVDRSQITLSAESLDDNPMLIIDAFVNALALRALGCKGIMPEPIGRPSYYPAILLKLYIYDYLSQVQSSRRLPPDADRDGRSVVGPEGFNLLPGAAHVLRQTSSHFRELTSAGTPVTKATAVDRTPLSGHPPRSPGCPRHTQNDEAGAIAPWH